VSARSGYTELVMLALKAGASANVLNEQVRSVLAPCEPLLQDATPLDVAKSSDVARLILEHFSGCVFVASFANNPIFFLQARVWTHRWGELAISRIATWPSLLFVLDCNGCGKRQLHVSKLWSVSI
jgi:hypothetical protein